MTIMKPATERVDARTGRWREHRLKVRADFVDAAFRALAKYGPDLNMDDIAREAGAAKPKLYRHFENKTDLYAAIVDRIQDKLWQRILISVNMFTDSAATVIRRAMTEYVSVVDEDPNVFRFLVYSHFAQQTGQSAGALQAAQSSASKSAQLIGGLLDAPGVSTASLELTAYSIFGAVGSATDWWLNPDRATDPSMTTERFIEHLEATAASALDATARLNGIDLDLDQPLQLAFRATANDNY